MAFGARDAEFGEIGPQARQRALVQESGQIVGAVRHELAATEPDEQVEEFALHGFGATSAGGFGKRRMRNAEGARVDAQAREAFEQALARRAHEQQRKQRVFARTRGRDLIDGFTDCGSLDAIAPAVEVGSEPRAPDAGHGLHRDDVLGRYALPLLLLRRTSPSAPPLARIASERP